MIIRRISFTFILMVFSHVHAGGESSGGSIAKFKMMSPEQALQSVAFQKVIERRILPQSSLSFNPASDLCIEQEYVRTVRPRTTLTCAVWLVKDYETGNTVGFISFKNAVSFSNSNQSGQRSEPFCPNENRDFEIYAADKDRVELSYKIDFFAKNAKKTGSEYLGTHSYMIDYCTKEFIDLPWVEWSFAE